MSTIMFMSGTMSGQVRYSEKIERRTQNDIKMKSYSCKINTILLPSFIFGYNQ